MLSKLTMSTIARAQRVRDELYEFSYTQEGDIACASFARLEMPYLTSAIRELSAALETERAEVARLRGELAVHRVGCADVSQFYVDEVDYDALGETDDQA